MHLDKVFNEKCLHIIFPATVYYSFIQNSGLISWGETGEPVITLYLSDNVSPAPKEIHRMSSNIWPRGGFALISILQRERVKNCRKIDYVICERYTSRNHI